MLPRRRSVLEIGFYQTNRGEVVNLQYGVASYLASRVLFGIWQSEAFRVARVFVKERVDLSGQFRISVDFLAITVCHKQLSVGASCIEFDITRLELLLNWALDTHSSIP